jgi:hypothetical protein
VIRYLLTAHKGKVIAGVVAAALLVCFAVLGAALPGGHAGGHNPSGPTRTARSGPTGIPSGATPGYNVLSPRELSLLAAAPKVAPATTPLLPPISPSDRTQPDLYARAFFTALFTHPYTGVTRAQMLAWVQAQQALSPFITGGTPPEMNRLLVESVSDPAWSNHGVVALPDDSGWAQAVAGRASVRIDQLTCRTPPDWETAISDGDITDPGITARLVSADMTMTWNDGGKLKTQNFSVALTMLLEAPPTASQYGVIVIADTSVVQGASS